MFLARMWLASYGIGVVTLLRLGHGVAEYSSSAAEPLNEIAGRGADWHLAARVVRRGSSIESNVYFDNVVLALDPGRLRLRSHSAAAAGPATIGALDLYCRDEGDVGDHSFQLDKAQRPKRGGGSRPLAN